MNHTTGRVARFMSVQLGLYQRITIFFINLIIIFSTLFSYTPFNRNPVLIFPNEYSNLNSNVYDRNQWDPSFIRLGADGNYNILIGPRFSKVTPDGEILINDKRIFEPFNLTGNYYYSYVVDYENNLHIVVNAFDTVPDTVYHYYSESEYDIEIEYQKKTYYVKLDSNGDPIPGMNPFIINRNFDLGYYLDLIIGYDGYLHVVEKSTLANISGYGDDANIYYSRLTTNGEVLVNFESILDDPQTYSFDGMELIQDSEGYLQFVWHSLYGTPWYRFDTNGNLNNYIYFGPPDYSPFNSFFSIPNEPYDLLILFEVGPPDYTVFYNIYPDGTLVNQAYIPYPDELYGGIDGNGGWLKDYMDNQENIHNMFRRTIFFEDQEPVTKYFYQKLTSEGEFIVPPFEEDIMSQFGEPPREIVADINGNPAFIIAQYQINDIYFTWFDPDSVRIEIGESYEITDSTVFAPIIISCDQWEDLLPVKELSFDIYYDPNQLTLNEVNFSIEAELMGTHTWEIPEDGMIQFSIADTAGLVIHSGPTPLIEMSFINLEDNLEIEPILLKRTHTAIDTLNFQLDYQTLTQTLSGGIFGDINNDLAVDIIDIIHIVNFIIEESFPLAFQQWAADMNRDENLNVLDIIRIINIILD